MVNYALKKGKPLKNIKIEMLHDDLENDFKPGDEEKEQITIDKLLTLYNQLIKVVAPANPRTIIMLEESEKHPKLFRFLGPLPIVRQFMLTAILSLFGMITISLSSLVNVDTIELSMLQGSGIEQIFRLGFLLSAASVGASFYALFKMNSYIAKETFDPTYSVTYWTRYVLGIVAGLLLSEMLVEVVDPALIQQASTDTKGDVDHSAGGPLTSLSYLMKPVLAILGGFSANLVYRILSRLVETVESLFKGNGAEQMQRKEQEFAAQTKEQTGEVKQATTQHLLHLKQSLIDQSVDSETLNKIDEAIKNITDS